MASGKNIDHSQWKVRQHFPQAYAEPTFGSPPRPRRTAAVCIAILDLVRGTWCGAVVGRQVSTFAGIHQIGKLGPPGAELFRDMAPGVAGVLAVRLLEGSADCGGDDRVLSLGHMCQGIAYPMNACVLQSHD